MSVFRFLCFTVLSIGLSASSKAAILFSDDFNSQSLGLGVTGLGPNWTVVNNVDVLDSANPGFGIPFVTGPGRYIDLGGTGKNIPVNATITTTQAFGLSTLGTDKSVSVDLAGDGRGRGPSTVRLSLDTWFTDIVVASSDPFKTFAFVFAGTNQGALSISFLSPSSEQGPLLDNVRVDGDLVRVVPEPASVVCFGLLGLVGVVVARRRR